MQMVTFSAVSGPVPTVTSVSPNSGSTAGGTAVTITGTNFAAGRDGDVRKCGGDECGGGEQHDHHGDNAGGECGRGDRDGDRPERTEREPGERVYLHASPTVTGVSPNGGPLAGGTAVTITGTNFATGATVKFGSTAASNVVVVNSTTITATTPAGSAGAVTVTVTNSNGLSGSLSNGFTYALPPTVTSVSPNSGSTLGGRRSRSRARTL